MPGKCKSNARLPIFAIHTLWAYFLQKTVHLGQYTNVETPFLVKQQAADNAIHTTSGGTAIGKLHMHVYNTFVLTMKSAHLVVNGWLFTMSILSQPAVLAQKPG